MSDTAAFLNEAELPFRFCPGCTHGIAIEALTKGLERLGPRREKTVAVSDIGCVGLADRYLSFSTFHGLHGRSIAYAMGLKLARPELSVVTLVGDGGIGIGAAHLVSACRRDLPMCVVVFDNFNFGMTGGQLSPTTFTGALTTTTPDGNPERPLDVCALARAAGASFVARVSGFDPALPEVLAEAMAHRGFALVDVWEICTAHFMRANRFQKTRMERALEEAGSGILHREERQAPAPVAAEPRSGFDLLARFRIPVAPSPASLAAPATVTLAGSAGMKIRYAASLLARAGIAGGLRAAQLDEFPITVLTGYSLADVVLSPGPIEHLESDPVDVLLALTDDGYARFLARGRHARRVYRMPGVASRSSGEIEIAPRAGLRREHAALRALARMLEREALLPAEALREAIRAHGYRGTDGRDLEAQIAALAP